LARLSRRRIAAHAIFEFADSLPESFHQFGNLAPPKKYKDDCCHNHQMPSTKFHSDLPFTPGCWAKTQGTRILKSGSV
jgi:hypothetical protein